MKEYKVVLHVDELKKWKLVLANVSNLIDAAKDSKLTVSVLANAEAVRYYDKKQAEDDIIRTIKVLEEKGVEFIACNNALVANDLDQSIILGFVKIVPAGVLELVERQSDGYAYIKP